jgi:hypothetical protein
VGRREPLDGRAGHRRRRLAGEPDRAAPPRRGRQPVPGAGRRDRIRRARAAWRTTGDATEVDPAQAPALPGSLESAIAAFAADTALREVLGERFSAYYETSRRWELRAWQRAVTDWERQRYELAV